jgi:hypothetical protein
MPVVSWLTMFSRRDSGCTSSALEDIRISEHDIIAVG